MSALQELKAEIISSLGTKEETYSSDIFLGLAIVIAAIIAYLVLEHGIAKMAVKASRFVFKKMRNKSEKPHRND